MILFRFITALQCDIFLKFRIFHKRVVTLLSIIGAIGVIASASFFTKIKLLSRTSITLLVCSLNSLIIKGPLIKIQCEN